ncbi:hypothetical protein RJ639_018075 [Escallonia herrerae]|uniref:HIG1 domain-containing protein n=1 Tax=Escallonia herrerae TaxID=1293975 RepID=A0AA88V702_9ASTE|nr:hypothetical protein RJ639_018075 [Escallonia herrerae]
MEALQSWVSEHKLTSIGSSLLSTLDDKIETGITGTVWASTVGASLAYSRARSPIKPSLRLIHARMHAQALTLAVLSGAAVYHYYEKHATEEGKNASSSKLHG